MFKIVNYKKLNWFKNASDNGGAMQKVIDGMQSNEVCVHIQNQKNGRMWTSTTQEQLIKIIDKNIGAYEVISKYPHKAYFDIDCDDGTPLETFKKIIQSKIQGELKWAISGSETETKNSYHITLNNYTINNIVDRENFKQFVMNLHNENNGFDTKVYTNNRNMKIINQSKQNDTRVQLIIEDENPKNHLITCFINPKSKSVSEFASSKLETKTKVKSNRVNILALPEVKVDTNIDMSDLKNPLVLLKLLPISSEFDHKYTFMVARFAYNNGISFHQFFDWYKAKDDSDERKNKWITHWNKLDDFPPVNIKQIMYALEKYYPNIMKKKE